MPERGAQHVADLRAAMYVLQAFGYYSGLRVSFTNTCAVVRNSDPDAPEVLSVAGCSMH